MRTNHVSEYSISDDLRHSPRYLEINSLDPGLIKLCRWSQCLYVKHNSLNLKITAGMMIEDILINDILNSGNSC